MLKILKIKIDFRHKLIRSSVVACTKTFSIVAASADVKQVNTGWENMILCIFSDLELKKKRLRNDNKKENFYMDNIEYIS